MTLLWAHSVRPYTHFSGLAPKERKGSAGQVVSSLYCLLPVCFQKSNEWVNFRITARSV